MTRPEILSLASSAGGLLDAPKVWSVDTLAMVMQMESDGLIELQAVEFVSGNRTIRVKAWFAVTGCSAFDDEEAGR